VNSGLTSSNVPVGCSHVRFLILGVLLVCCLCGSCGDPIDPFFPILEVTPDSLDFGGVLTERSFQIVNEGTKALHWSAESPDTFITLDPQAGDLEPSPGQNDTVVTVTVNRAGIGDGVYSSIIRVTSTDGGTRNVRVKLTVGVFELPIIGSLDTQGGDALAVAVSANHAYVPCGSLGRMYILDVTNPATPTEAYRLNLPGNPLDVAVYGDYGYVASGGSGLIIVDVSDPTSAFQVGNSDTPGSALDVVLDGSLAYIADSRGGLRLINVANPSVPVSKWNYVTSHEANNLDQAEGYAFVLCGDYYEEPGVLEIINVQGLSPVFADSCGTTGPLGGVDAVGDYVYVASWGFYASALEIFDVSNPQAVELIKRIDTRQFFPGGTSNSSDVLVDGIYAYLADSEGGLHVLDISNPVDPKFIAFCDTPYRARGVAVSGDFVYIADEGSGLQIIDRSLLRP